jgi:hypothetical protein
MNLRLSCRTLAPEKRTEKEIWPFFNLSYIIRTFISLSFSRQDCTRLILFIKILD